MRLPRMTTRRWMAAVAFTALALAATIQSVRLQQALVRERRLRAEAEVQKALAEVRLRRSQVLMDQMLAGVANQQRSPSSAAPRP